LARPATPVQALDAELVQALVDLGVDAADEERRDGVDLDVPPASLRFLMPLMNALPTLRYDSTLNSSVTLTLMPSEIACSTAGHAGVGARDLDHQVRAVDALPVHARGLERRVGVVREVGLDLERHVAVEVLGLVVDAAEDVAGRLHVAHDHRAVGLAAVGAGLGELGQLVVVVVGAEDRLLEDRRIGGRAAQRLLLDHPLELAALDERSAQQVQPRAAPRGGQGGEVRVDVDG
jgi:hypothetical protein